MNRQEKLLTKEEIREILSDNYNNPVFRYQGIRLMATEDHSFKQVIAVSDRHSLILIKGNEDTGDQHIRERHDYWSTKSYTILNENEELVFQNQSKFPKDVPPFSYLRIADEIFKKDNFSENNSHPMADRFDLYIGEYSFDNIKMEKIKLILYKGTKIIHSLFLTRAIHNRKRIKKFPFTRGKILFKLKKGTNIKETFIPYRDVNFKLRFGISIEKYPAKNLEHVLILIFNPENIDYYNYIKILERKLTKFRGEKFEEVTYQYCDLREAERFILQIDRYLKSGKLEIGEKFGDQFRRMFSL